MEFTILTSDYFKPVKWSGGTTTELFIFPVAADYKLKNFQFRISTATVETDKSDFTVLNGISRKLMVLDGQVTLNHEDHYSIQLKRFEVDEFDGGWKTSSLGSCTDFNLMTTGKTTGVLTVKVLGKEESINYYFKENNDWVLIYIYSGKVRTVFNKEIAVLNKGDLLIINTPVSDKLEIKGFETTEMVLSEIIGYEKSV